MPSIDRKVSERGDTRTGRRGYGDDEVDLAAVWRALADGKWIIILVTVVTTAIATTAALVMTPIYRGEVLLAARSEDGGIAAGMGGALGGLASLAGVSLGADDSQRTQAIAMLRSRQFAEQFIRERELLLVLFDDIWDKEKKSWKVDDSEDIPTMRRAVRRFLDDVRSVSEDADTGLVSLAMEWKDPSLAAEWANDFVERLNVEMRQRAIAEAEQSIAYLQEEVNKTSVVELKLAIYSLIEDQIQSIMLANVREEFAFEILDPAVVPGPDERVAPKRALMVVLGIMLGIMLGVTAIFFKNALRSVRMSDDESESRHAR